ncbi:MAG: pyridoxamine 5'-phosphate oxidase [Alphaproteobacteria bacterium]|nr:MAG: pyridoxamine 5'-phosphate oxidase [Alphaproteobacteria bacterium]
MNQHVSDIAFTPAVKTQQTARGSRDGYARMEQGRGWKSAVDERLKDFIAERDSFYLGTTNAQGQPYIQHRGGPKGFLKVLDEHTLAFADFGGNQQYITLGNLSDNEQAFIFLMDYPKRRRIKVWGRARVVDDNEELLKKVTDNEYAAIPERVIVFTIEAWDVNCPQHIEPRFTEADIAEQLVDVKKRIGELEAENIELKRRLDLSDNPDG